MKEEYKKEMKNAELIERYIGDLYSKDLGIYEIIDMVKRFTPDYNMDTNIDSMDIFAKMLSRARDYFGRYEYLNNSYNWHTRGRRVFLRKRRILRRKIREGGLK